MTIAEKLIESVNAPDYAAIHKHVFRVAFDCLIRCWPPEDSVEYFRGKAYPICAVAYADMGDNELGREMVDEIYKYLETVVLKMRKEKESADNERAETRESV